MGADFAWDAGEVQGGAGGAVAEPVQQLHLEKLDVVHTHTWYVSMAGFLAKKLYGIPFVLTTHSLEPLRAWKAEQLGVGVCAELVDGEDGDPGCGCDCGRVEWDEGGYSEGVSGGGCRRRFM